MEKKLVKGVMRWLANIMIWASEDVESRMDVLLEELGKRSRTIYRALMEAVEDEVREEFEWVAKTIIGSVGATWSAERGGGEGGEVQKAPEGEKDEDNKGISKALHRHGGEGKPDSGVDRVH